MLEIKKELKDLLQIIADNFEKWGVKATISGSIGKWNDKKVIWLQHFNDPNLSYEFNESMFGITENGRFIYGSDSGCSCPSPFNESRDYYSDCDISENLDIKVEDLDYKPEDWDVLLFESAQRIAMALTEPDKLYARSILDEENAEIRRELINKKGLENFVSELNPIALDESNLGKLLKVEVKNDEAIVLAKVKDSSTDREYFLRVPPGTKTIRDAIAWTFGMTEQEYQPIKET